MIFRGIGSLPKTGFSVLRLPRIPPHGSHEGGRRVGKTKSPGKKSSRRKKRRPFFLSKREKDQILEVVRPRLLRIIRFGYGYSPPSIADPKGPGIRIQDWEPEWEKDVSSEERAKHREERAKIDAELEISEKQMEEDKEYDLSFLLGYNFQKNEYVKEQKVIKDYPIPIRIKKNMNLSRAKKKLESLGFDQPFINSYLDACRRVKLRKEDKTTATSLLDELISDLLEIPEDHLWGIFKRSGTDKAFGRVLRNRLKSCGEITLKLPDRTIAYLIEKTLESRKFPFSYLNIGEAIRKRIPHVKACLKARLQKEAQTPPA